MKLAQKYRPVKLNKRYRIKFRLQTGRQESYIWCSRVKWYPVGWKINNQTLGRIFSTLHYLSCHAPEPVQKKWRRVYNEFQAKYFASKGKASVRYLNTYTAYKWL